MFSVFVSVFCVVQNIGVYSIFISYNTGKFIVSSFITCFDIIVQLVNTLWTLLTIINEDLVVFIFDVLHKISFLIHAIIGCVEHLADILGNTIYFVISLIEKVVNLFFEIYQALLHLVLHVIVSIGNLFAAIKQFIVLFGSGMWFALTIIPISITYFTMLMFYSVGRIFDEIISGIHLLTIGFLSNSKALINFVIDVPLESIAGLLSCACLTYAIFKFNIALYGRLRNITVFLLRIFNDLYVNFWRTMLVSERRNNERNTQTNLRAEEENLRKQDEGDTESGDNRLCVICMEKNKCMLAMPCRHLCTCADCQNKLQRYTRTCPICRRHVSYTIHVY